MRQIVIKKFFYFLFLLFVAYSFFFFIIRVIPGNPAEIITGNLSSKKNLEIAKKTLNLDKSIYRQYFDFIAGICSLDFGESYIYKQPVLNIIIKYLPNTFVLSVTSMLMTIFISTLLSILSYLKANGFIDLIVTIISNLFLAVPNFLLGPLFIIFFSYYLKILPISGSNKMLNIVLPVLTLSLSMSAYLTKTMRTSLHTERDKPYVEFARGKGLSDLEILFKHIVKNALIPISTVVGLQFGALVSGVIITENVFSWHGIGTILVAAIKNRDYPLIQGITVFILFIYLLINLFVDISYYFINPRIRIKGMTFE